MEFCNTVTNIYLRSHQYSIAKTRSLGPKSNDIVIGYDRGTEFQYIIKDLTVYWRPDNKSDMIHELK